MAKSEKKERMGLQDAMNTRIGGWEVTGLSGGQKRRVSICVELLTSGLDNAASYYVMSRIANLDKGDGTPRTIVTSIHLPSSEVFQLFDSSISNSVLGYHKDYRESKDYYNSSSANASQAKHASTG
ncbi:ABC transporter G family member 11-like [Pyrus ussuriensis x Pyrus communis]|uniref:ABC transporter G family member 11-like n=1 Tax=Pyrus ussuriensis x Pyrus communis TaxID=2448454 RepID=A0A5N5I889_9ROSA|nr:ABC transporter G family member 11-like [Pyrus ussuriensis x Pyrus communis]